MQYTLPPPSVSYLPNLGLIFLPCKMETLQRLPESLNNLMHTKHLHIAWFITGA